MDFSKLSANQQLTVGAAAAMVIISFFPWFGISGLVSFSAWDSGFPAVIGTVLVIAAGVILVMEGMDKAPVDAPAEIAFYLAAGGAGLVLIRLIFTWGAPRRFGLFLGLIAAAATAYGAYQNRLDNS